MVYCIENVLTERYLLLIIEARDRIMRWIEDYNTKRLHSGLRYLP
ncbi:MAG TPA: hypothetical protein ENG63_01320 [Candidatus Desulfofervidus auxilii]|uniref:Integrase catalytic domain-containing protein n=1 Tax=Desulfofervidus auxilii TaxID=1621989 RepID=A0A7C0Y617_DESA2|nr:hypothetical protein [Candidatus Desulfofervidus auxilii]